MKKKVKWLVHKLLARGQKRVLRVWFRYVENLKGEEEVVHIFEPETRRILSDDEEKRSINDLRNCQEGRSGLLSCQVGNGKRSSVDLKDF
jgi:hypothetical protein